MKNYYVKKDLIKLMYEFINELNQTKEQIKENGSIRYRTKRFQNFRGQIFFEKMRKIKVPKVSPACCRSSEAVWGSLGQSLESGQYECMEL